MNYATQEVREAARLVAEAALSDIRDMFSENPELEGFEDGYDLLEDGEGGLWVLCGQDVELHVDATGEQDGALRPREARYPW